MTKIEIKDLKGVGDVELNLDSNQRVFAFLGTNGVGKTKTLQALCASLYIQNQLVYISNKDTDKKIDANDFLELFREIKNGFYDFFISFDINNINETVLDGNFAEKNIYVFLTTNSRIVLNKTERANFDDFSEKELNKIKNNFFSIMDTAKTIIQSPLAINYDIHAWFIDRAKSTNIYQKEKDNKKSEIDTILDALNRFDERIEKELSIDGNDNVYLTISGEERELSELSSGFLSLVKIIQSIIASFSAFSHEKDLLNVKGVVLIDEIESHLHLEWQVKIIPILKNLFPNTTFFITTHSPLVLSQLNEGEAYLLKRDNDGVVRSEIINSPNTRLLENVLQDAFGVNLNQLKRENMENIDQSKAKKKLLDLLNSQASS